MSSPSHRLRTWRFRCFLAGVVLVSAVDAAWGQSPAVVRVEEDWELVIATPDVDSDSPQVTCVISPSGDTDSLYATFEVNHRSLPAFTPGGLQLQVWSGETALAQHAAPNTEQLNVPGEVIRWTQAMDVSTGHLVFEIINGTSSTWGEFGGQGYLRAVVPSAVADLNGYQPDVSVRNSGAGYAANRVQSLVLKRVRYFLADGQQVVDTTERVVHAQP